jgi:pimeloyl-ACP methyl ester carboxylesterase
MHLIRTAWMLTLLVGCAPLPPSQILTAAADTPRPIVQAPTAAESAAAPRVPEVFEGTGGLMLHGVWRPTLGPNVPAVLLLHMYAGNSTDWDALATQLQEAGIASLAIDLRGHGDTGGAEDWELARQDVVAAYQWLTEQDRVDPHQTGVVGASIGANLALWLGAQQPDITALVLLSPGFEYFRVPIDGLIEAYGSRSVFLAASDEDSYSADTVRSLAQSASGPVTLMTFPAAGHGTDMLVSEPTLAEEIVRFLAQHLLGPQ